MPPAEAIAPEKDSSAFKISKNKPELHDPKAQLGRYSFDLQIRWKFHTLPFLQRSQLVYRISDGSCQIPKSLSPKALKPKALNPLP